MILNHNGFVAEVAYEDGDSLMHGSVINTRAVLHFAGGNIEELRQALADTIADYREWCKERGVEPEKPYSGTLSLRIAPELHRRIAERAAKAGESINQFIAERLEEVA
ncbi:MAG: type II toxin-antitoxin system HicB family antitoxin [Methylocella sp.]